MLTTLLFLLAAPTSDWHATFPLVINCLGDQNRKLRLLVDTSSEHTTLFEDNMIAQTKPSVFFATFWVDDVKLEAVNLFVNGEKWFLRQVAAAHVDGVLGRDLLSKLRLGIDRETGKTEVWPATEPDDTAQKWVSGGWIVSLPIKGDVSAGYSVEVLLSGSPVTLALDTGSPFANLDDGNYVKVAKKSCRDLPLFGRVESASNTGVVVSGMSMGAEPIPFYVSTADGNKPASLSFDSFGCPRMVFDFVEKRTWFKIGDPLLDSLSSALSHMLGLKVRVNEEGAWVTMPGSIEKGKLIQVGDYELKAMDAALQARNAAEISDQIRQMESGRKAKSEATVLFKGEQRKLAL
ncbi:MAG: hypothetical protein BGO01_06890 [Armatimonadetes bacterium 55-13]|nr:hypothetical protein [Armatimonadota bacterium]OJU62226.1 MAG: hypothetical protein BGO01_06890 [Armatimonadetes bacterium 55-13]